MIVFDFSLAFDGRSAHEGISRRRRRVMEETDGSAKAARYAANPARKELGVSYCAITQRGSGRETEIPVPVAPVMISLDML